jgi:hypothetical protein
MAKELLMVGPLTKTGAAPKWKMRAAIVILGGVAEAGEAIPVKQAAVTGIFFAQDHGHAKAGDNMEQLNGYCLGNRQCG